MIDHPLSHGRALIGHGLTVSETEPNRTRQTRPSRGTATGSDRLQL